MRAWGEGIRDGMEETQKWAPIRTGCRGEGAGFGWGIRRLSVRLVSPESGPGFDGLGDVSLSKGQKAY